MTTPSDAPDTPNPAPRVVAPAAAAPPAASCDNLPYATMNVDCGGMTWRLSAYHNHPPLTTYGVAFEITSYSAVYDIDAPLAAQSTSLRLPQAVFFAFAELVAEQYRRLQADERLRLQDERLAATGVTVLTADTYLVTEAPSK